LHENVDFDRFFKGVEYMSRRFNIRGASIRMDFRARELDFQEADRRYTDLQRQHSRGAITDMFLDEQLRQLMVRDEEGVWWAKSKKSGRWHYHDGAVGMFWLSRKRFVGS
jgi:hypothetical protein